jgi:hypothetical protein
LGAGGGGGGGDDALDAGAALAGAGDAALAGVGDTSLGGLYVKVEAELTPLPWDSRGPHAMHTRPQTALASRTACNEQVHDGSSQ